jgi:hypothetical protein
VFFQSIWFKTNPQSIRFVAHSKQPGSHFFNGKHNVSVPGINVSHKPVDNGRYGPDTRGIIGISEPEEVADPAFGSDHETRITARWKSGKSNLYPIKK